jgi:hypothetical protein
MNNNFISREYSKDILLRNVNLQSVISAYTVFREIEMFVNFYYNVENKEVKLNDNNIKYKHGFTKCSFKSCKR